MAMAEPRPMLLGDILEGFLAVKSLGEGLEDSLIGRGSKSARWEWRTRGRGERVEGQDWYSGSSRGIDATVDARNIWISSAWVLALLSFSSEVKEGLLFVPDGPLEMR